MKVGRIKVLIIILATTVAQELTMLVLTPTRMVMGGLGSSRSMMPNRCYALGVSKSCSKYAYTIPVAYYQKTLVGLQIGIYMKSSSGIGIFFG